MPDRMQILKCDDCGAVLEVLDGCQCQIACCGKALAVLEEKTADAAGEKHVPVCERADGSVTVKVGTVAHPMEEKHYIQWIEVVQDGKVCRQFLKPGDAPEAAFKVEDGAFSMREHCNIHGLWRGESQ